MLEYILKSIESLLLNIFNMSITASWLILTVIVLRMIFKKAPKWINCLLWAIAAVRLVVPFSFESVLSIIPKSQTVTSDTFNYNVPVINGGGNVIAGTNAAVIPSADVGSNGVGSAGVSALQIIAAIWLVGMAAMLIYTLVSYIKLRKSVGASMKMSGNVYVCNNIGSPFILGFVKPKIYLPSSLDFDDAGFIIAHEKAHLKRLDYIWKPLGFIVLTVHWFNPLCWIAYMLLCKDIELACDERVIKDYDISEKKQYSETLLSCSVSRRRIAACPLAFGETGVKERIKSVLSYKKPTLWIIIAAFIASTAASVCLLTDPVKTSSELMGSNYAVEKTLYDSVIGNKAETVEHPEFCVTADKKSYYVKWQNSDEWTYEGDLEKVYFTKDQLLSLIGTDIIHSYNGGEIVEAYYAGEIEHLVFLGKSGDVFVAGAHYDEGKIRSLSSLYKVKPTLEKNTFDTGFFERTLTSHIGRNVYAFEFVSSDKNKNHAVVGFLAGDSKNIKEMTNIGFAVFKTGKKGFLLTDCKDYLFAKDKSDVFICPQPATLNDTKQYDVILNVGDKLATVEKSFNGKTQLQSVDGAFEMLLFEVEEAEYENGAEKAVYKCFDKNGNELSFSGGLLERNDPNNNNLTYGNVTVTDTSSERSDVYINASGITYKDGALILDAEWKNLSDKEIFYGEAFYLLKKEGSKWVSFDDSEICWNLPAYYVKPSSENDKMNTRKEYNITAVYGALTTGTYRFSTNFSFENEGSKGYSVSVDFVINPPTNAEALKSKYPQYFDLDTSNGLTVYVWPMAEKSYYFGLMSGNEHKNEDLLSLKGVTLEEMKVILDSYGTKVNVYLKAAQMPYSSYFQDISDEELAEIETALGLGFERDNYELKATSIPYEKNWLYGDLSNIVTADIKAVKAENHSGSQKAYLFSADSEDSIYLEKYLAVETKNKVLFADVGGSYYDEFYVCDVDGDGENEIVIHQCCGMTGGAGSYLSYIYKIQNEKIIPIFSTLEGFDTGFTSTLKKDFIMTVNNKFTGYETNVDCSDRGYVGEFYNKNGKVIKNQCFDVDMFCEFTPEDIDADGVYEIRGSQYTSLSCHADGIGMAESILKYNKQSGEFEVVSASYAPDSLDNAVSEALLSDNAERYYKGEFAAEGHIILGTEEKDGFTNVYAKTCFAYYGFQNDNLVTVSEGMDPALLKFKVNNGKYELSEITYAEQGETFGSSVKAIFPKKYQKDILEDNADDAESMRSQMVSQAKRYLESLGRTGEIGDYTDFKYTYPFDFGVDPIIGKLTSGLNELVGYPSWIGTKESIENGIRYVYEMTYNKEKNLLVYSKYPYGADKADEVIFVDAQTGEIIDKDSP